jgi:arabinofuranosyltransferase
VPAAAGEMSVSSVPAAASEMSVSSVPAEAGEMSGSPAPRTTPGRGARGVGSDGRVILLALAIALVPYSLLVARFDFLCDDAYIAFRYARHLAQGAGLVFNVGESPPVEGYSNFLWVAWLALFERLGIDVGVVARATSILCGVALIFLVARHLRRRIGLDALGTTAVTVFFACLPPVALWSTGGLESMAFALALFAAWERIRGEPDAPRGIQAGLCALAAALLRADGALWATVVLVAAAAPEIVPATRTTAGSRARLRGAVQAFAVMLLGAAVHAIARRAYHGAWLPNTASVKAGLSGMRLERGLLYVASFLLAIPGCALAAIAAGATARSLRSELALACAPVLAFAVAYAVFVGGDFMPMGRFLLPALPFVALLLGGAVAVLARDRPLRAAALAAACTLLVLLPSFDVNVVPAGIRERCHFRWNDAHLRSEVAIWRGMRDQTRNWARLGRVLATHTQPGESIVIGNVGAVGYFTELHVFDVFGLVSPEVARRDAPLVRASPGHDKVVGVEFFLDRHPTYLNAWLAPTSSPPEEDVPRALLEIVRSGRATIERVPLAVDPGLASRLELRLVRFVQER